MKVHGYVRMPPVEKTITPHLCPSLITLGMDLSLPSKSCRLTAHLADKGYTFAGEKVSTLHVMAVMQVFQAMLLQSMDVAASTQIGGKTCVQ